MSCGCAFGMSSRAMSITKFAVAAAIVIRVGMAAPATADVGNFGPERVRIAAGSAAWMALLHYRSFGTDGGVKSEVDRDGFFITPGGYVSPQAELREGLRLLTGGGEPAAAFACRFPARAQWIAQEFGIPGLRAQIVLCEELGRWIREVGAKRVSLVFASAYIDSPSSMFGHPLLRFDGDRPVLSSYAVNYAVPIPPDDSLTYPLKALFGRYRGEFSVLPFYQKLREYQFIEQRDIWEYPLDLTESEVEAIVLHLWELQSVEFQYFFLNENCGSRLLDLIEVARSRRAVRGPAPLFVVPKDVVKGLVTDLAIPDAINQLTSAGALVPERNALAVKPHIGHETSSIDVAWSRLVEGNRSSENALDLTLRGGYHLELDPPNGYPAGAYIEFLTARLRIAADVARLEGATLLRIDSQQPSADGRLARAWTGGVEISRRHVPGTLVEDRLSLQGHIGLGYSLPTRAGTLIGRLGARASVSRSGADLGAGYQVGARASLTPRARWSVLASRYWFADAGVAVDELSVGLGGDVGDRLAIIGQFDSSYAHGERSSRAVRLGIRRYF